MRVEALLPPSSLASGFCYVDSLRCVIFPIDYNSDGEGHYAPKLVHVVSWHRPPMLAWL